MSETEISFRLVGTPKEFRLLKEIETELSYLTKRGWYATLTKCESIAKDNVDLATGWLFEIRKKVVKK